MSEITQPILYSFRRCPYAMRARLAVMVSETPLALREIILRDKPEEMVQASPKATVPVLVLPDGMVIDESLDIMLWALDKHDPEGWLQDDMADILALIDDCEEDFKGHLDRYKYANRYDGVDPVDEREKACVFLALLENRLEKHAFLFGEEKTLADMAIVPFVRQFANTDRAWFDSCDFACVRAWTYQFTESDIFLSVMHKYSLWQAGDEPIIFG